MNEDKSHRSEKKRRGPPPTRFKGVNLGINDAYGDLRQYINKYCTWIPKSHLSSTRDIYSLSYIYEIIKDALPEEVVRKEVGKQLAHQANELQDLLPRLVDKALKHGKITPDSIIDEILDFQKFCEFSKVLKRRPER